MEPITKEHATNLAAQFEQSSKIEIPDSYIRNAYRFNDGWLVSASSPDSASITGAHYFLVLDDGIVAHEAGSLPPTEYVSRHSRVKEGLQVQLEDGEYIDIDTGNSTTS